MRGRESGAGVPPAQGGRDARPTSSRYGLRKTLLRPLTLLLALAICCAAACQAGDATVPIWGQILDPRPQTLNVVIVSSGAVLYEASAKIVEGDGSLYYAADLAADSLAAALAAGAPPALDFRTDGALSGKSIPLPDRALPRSVALKDGAPHLPQTEIFLASAELFDGAPRKLELVTALGRRLPTAASGSLRWESADSTFPTSVVSTELAADSVTVSRIVTVLADDAPVPRLWRVTWVPDDPVEPRPYRAVTTGSGAQRLHDSVDELSKTTSAAPAAKADVYGSRVGLEPADYLEAGLECALTPELDLAAFLAGWGLGDPTSPPLPLRDARVTLLPGNRAWIACRWFAPERANLGGLKLIGPKDAPLLARCTLRRLVRSTFDGSGGSY